MGVLISCSHPVSHTDSFGFGPSPVSTLVPRRRRRLTSTLGPPGQRRPDVSTGAATLGRPTPGPSRPPPTGTQRASGCRPVPPTTSSPGLGGYSRPSGVFGVDATAGRPTTSAIPRRPTGPGPPTGGVPNRRLTTVLRPSPPRAPGLSFSRPTPTTTRTCPSPGGRGSTTVSGPPTTPTTSTAGPRRGDRRPVIVPHVSRRGTSPCPRGH